MVKNKGKARLLIEKETLILEALMTILEAEGEFFRSFTPKEFIKDTGKMESCKDLGKQFMRIKLSIRGFSTTGKNMEKGYSLFQMVLSTRAPLSAI